VVVRVEEDGSGIPAESLEDRLEALRRLENDGKGSGLGLSIARAIVVDQGSTLTLANRDGGGLRTEVRFPIGAH